MSDTVDEQHEVRTRLIRQEAGPEDEHGIGTPRRQRGGQGRLEPDDEFGDGHPPEPSRDDALGSARMVSSAPQATPVAGPARRGAHRLARRPAAIAFSLVALTVVGAALRLEVLGQSLFGDELSTYWIVTTHDLPGTLGFVGDTIEITPPLYFVLAWVAAQIDASPELLRAPSLIAGIAAIPLVYVMELARPDARPGWWPQR